MSSATLERETISVSEAARREAAELVERGRQRGLKLSVSVSIGGEEAKQVGPELLEVIDAALHIISSGNTPTIVAEPRDLTTTVAARRIGISRPALMRLIREGKLDAHKVGSHHRIRTAEADRFRREMLTKRAAEQRAAFDELRALEAELGV